MGEFKGILGKWSTEESYDSEYRQPVININNDRGIESFITVWSGSDKLMPADRANAQLISKAPQMLEQLKELFELLEQHTPDWYSMGRYKVIKQLIEEATEVDNEKR